MDHPFHAAGGSALQILEHQLHLALIHSRRIIPYQRVILAKPVAPLVHADGTSQTPRFFHRHHRGIRGSDFLIPEKKLLHDEGLWRADTPSEKHHRKNTKADFHLGIQSAENPGARTLMGFSLLTSRRSLR